MKPSLQLRTGQHLTLTPQLQQSIRLLQLSTLELQQEIDQILLDNPLLERLDDPLPGIERLLPDGALRAAPATTNTASEAQSAPSERDNESNAADAGPDMLWPESSGIPRDEDDDSRPQLASAPTTLTDHLLAQMRLTTLSVRDRAIMTLIIGSLDEDGYLEESLEHILEHIPPELSVDLDEFSASLKLLQHFDPPGVGARTLAECLCLQLRQFDDLPMELLARAQIVVTQYLTPFAQRDFARILKALQWNADELRDVGQAIRRCTPHPGARFADGNSDHVVPDVIVKRRGTGFKVELNTQLIPKLHINAHYADIIRHCKCDNALTNRLQEARWLLKNVQQRFQTILRVSEAIVAKQRSFFLHGEIGMRPLVLREIADTLGLHESTISRVTTQKYMLTPHGMFELKYFFGSHVATETGGEASSTAIRALIKQIVDAEDPAAPLSDGKITDTLAQQGMVIARRTVAKYREALRIPPVALRRKF